MTPEKYIVLAIALFIYYVVPTYFMMDAWYKARGEDEWGGPPG